MKDKLGCCGLNCEKCDAKLATVHDDDELRKKTSKLWSSLNGVDITIVTVAGRAELRRIFAKISALSENAFPPKNIKPARIVSKRHKIQHPVKRSLPNSPQSDVWFFCESYATKKPNKQKGLVWQCGRGDGT